MKTVLVADDTTFMRSLIVKILNDNGFSVIGEAENGTKAVSKYKELKPDLVTMDITMPEMSGLEALKLIKEFDPEANIIMVTAMGQERMVREAIMLGAKSFIIKPFIEKHVIKTIKKVLSI